MLHGVVLSSQHGSMIKVTVRLHLGVIGLIAAFFAYSLLAVIAPEVAGTASKVRGFALLVAITATVAAGLRVGFYPEARAIRTALEDVLDARAA